MRHCIYIIWIITFILHAPFSWSYTPTLSPGDYWQCSAYDAEKRQWIANSLYERAAINKALESCKKESPLPATCRTAKEYCDAIIQGRSTRPMWRCTALDVLANAWPSGIYFRRDDAALAARAYCEQMSTVPESCYINLITCRNLNKRI